MAALLTADQQNTDRVAIEIEEARRMGIDVKQPDINQSYESFTVVTSGTETNETAREDEEVNTIRFGLKAIKNVGEHIAEVIIAERKENGPYKDISDFLERITDKDLNKKSLESLIRSGALEMFAERGRLLGNIDNLLGFNKEISKNKLNGQSSLFGDVPSLDFSARVQLMEKPEAGRQEKLSWEKELLGLYITEHPFMDYRVSLDNHIVPLRELERFPKNEDLDVAGIITKIKKIITRNNQSMIFAKIEDEYSNREVLVFPKLLESTADIWEEGRAVYIKGRLSDKDQEIKILANAAEALSLDTVESLLVRLKGRPRAMPREQAALPSQKSFLSIDFLSDLDEAKIAALKRVLLQYPGPSKVFFRLKNNGKKKIIATDFLVNINDELLSSLQSGFGQEIVVKSS